MLAETTLSFETGDGVLLEGALLRSTDGQIPLHGGVVLVHPHPLYGGSMHTPLVLALAQTLAASGFAVLRFNFRGVGKSEGTFGGGEAEEADIIAAVQALGAHPDIPRASRALVGYSFGAWVGVRALLRLPSVKAFVGIGTPLWHLSPATLSDDQRPRLFITGEHDDISPPHVLHSMALGVPHVHVHIIPNADHAYAGAHTQIVGQLVRDFLTQRLAA
nr:alpha/beta fold hydrolase [Ardenticatena sp.]